ncbi:MAG: hypothetical protein AAFR61_06450 [Bacteroidota bacterium]
MNLEELKYIWQNQPEEEGLQMGPEEIAALLRAKSRSTLGRINRNIYLEMAGVTLLGAIAYYFLGSKYGYNNVWIIVPTLGYILLSALFYRRKYRVLNGVGGEDLSLKESLEKLVAIMRAYMRFYVYAIAAGIPLLSIGGILTGFLEASQEDGRGWEEIPSGVWGIVAAVSFVYVGLAVLASRWYVDRLYGVHYRELKKYLAELQDVEYV